MEMDLFFFLDLYKAFDSLKREFINLFPKLHILTI